MGKRIIKLFIISLLSFISCTKENSKLGNGLVNVNGIDYKFNNISTKGNNTDKGKIISSSTLELDNNYYLVAELVETNENSIPLTKPSYTYENVTAVKILTFYKQEAKTENRLQDLNMTDKTFELPPEGECDVVFLGNVGSNTTSITMNNDEDKATGSSVNSGTNLCYIIKSYGNSIPTTENLSNMIPLFAQIGKIEVPTSTSDGWNIQSINNLKITSGCQTSSGDIAINKNSVSYTKTNSDYEIAIGNFNGNSIIEKNLNVIPNENNFIINADVKLSNKTNSVNISFDFNNPIESTKRYTIKFTIKRKGILIKFYANTQQLGIYSKTFDDAQQATIKANNSSSLTNANNASIVTAYLKYGEEITLPSNPKRAATTYFNPEDVMTFEGWYKQKGCAKADKISGKLILNVANFPELKTIDTIKLYAYFEPHFYYWDSPMPIRNGGQPIAINTTYASFNATNTEFKKLSSGANYKKYAAAPKFFDSGYTNDSQQGYWFLKWQPESGRRGTSSYPAISDEECNNYYSNNLYNITNGEFPTGYNIDDYFFVPILGEYNTAHGNIDCTTMDSENSYYWPSNFYASRPKIIETTVAQSVFLYSDYVYVYERGSDGRYRGRSLVNSGLLRYWPDSTYPGI